MNIIQFPKHELNIQHNAIPQFQTLAFMMTMNMRKTQTYINTNEQKFSINFKFQIDKDGNL